MGGRLEYLDAAVDGYRATGHVIVSLLNGKIGPAGAGDDPGIYMLVPKLAPLVGWNAARAMELFQLLLVTVCAPVALFGSWRRFSRPQSRAVACASVLAIVLLSLLVADVYLITPLVIAALVPMGMLALDANSRRKIVGAMIGAGIVAGFLNFFRAQSGTGVVIILVLLIWTSRNAKQHRYRATVPLLLGLLLSTGTTRLLLARRDSFLASQIHGYAPPTASHPVWLQTYIGFGFLTNPYVARYADDVAFDRMRVIAPGVDPLTVAGERIYRREVIRIAMEHPWFVLRSLAAKAGVLLLYLSPFLIYGLMCRRRSGPLDGFDTSFSVGIAFFSLPGLLTIPTPQYMAAAIALAIMYAGFSAAGERDRATLFATR
jgi:hypothetical protein